jgi:transposase
LRTERQRLTRWQPDSDLVREMRAKRRLIDQLINSITRYANRLRAVLLRCYPQPVGLFSDLTTQIGLAFLSAYPTAQAAQALTYAEFAAFCAAQGYTHPHRQPELYTQLQTPMPAPDPAIVAAYADQVAFLAHLLLTLVQRKRHTLRQVQDLFQAHPDYAVFDSLPGAGDLLAPSLLVKFGDHRGRFLTAADVQALAGTCPVTIWSGKKRYVKFRRACDREFRNIAQQFAISSVRQGVGWAIEYWGDARARGLSKAQAYRCLANRWLAVIWKMWQTRQPYDKAYHMRQRALRRQPRS